MKGTFYWHDYETFGTDVSRDRPVQFAGVRTDADFNVVGEPLMIYSQPARDVLPQPEACLVTGITPQQALAGGVPEREFIAQIHAEMAQPGTCSVGYNSLRFDDEVTRYTLYRNFYDPYAREYRDGNSRWDIIDMVRLTHALRPEGIVWPKREDGLPSFRLEQLTEANGIGHEAAHDALSDVYATIAVARLIRERQPRLYDYVLQHRDKQSAAQLLDLSAPRPVLHVSGMFGAARDNIALILPLAKHPTNSNEVICFDLDSDPAELQTLDADALRERLFTPLAEQTEGLARLGLKSVRLNRCPVLVTPKLLDAPTAERLQIDVTRCRQHRQLLAGIDGLSEKLQQVYSGRQLAPITDPDRMLYSGGFFSDADRRVMNRVIDCSPEQLAQESLVFEDRRLPEMLFRYRARNYPQSLTSEEAAQWEEQRFAYLTEAEAGASIVMDDFLGRIEQLQAQHDGNSAAQAVLQDLLAYSDQLLG
ncbi:exodeoxyribonuclease I [Candidatus Litorirhabdus singularis]|uniref:exodeoxyribonuclease I n=1 Tax=Candidatus Litorirhabdus singularis TaxID=2518993 RepID=UPI00242D8A9D|nr:exodeoxyribonuclease I [Candidatus Litorirhabdus singularis]